MRARLPWFLEFGWSGFGPVFDPKLLTVFVFAPSAAGVEAIERAARELPAVVGAETTVLVRVITFPEAFDPVLGAVGPNGGFSTASDRRRPSRARR